MVELSKTESTPAAPARIGLVLPGGGARAAYQVGVLRAISDLLPSRSANPFPIISGTSAGAINATHLAIHAERFRIATIKLERVWRNFAVNQVFRADLISMLRGGLHWFLAVISGGWLLSPPKSLLDNQPLRQLLNVNFEFERISQALEAGHLQALAIAAASYSSRKSITFFEALPDRTAWQRMRRGGAATKINVDHLMASAAVPFLFPSVMLGEEYFGDGSMRQATPFSAAIHLGADRLLVVGTRNDTAHTRKIAARTPSFGQIFGYMLDALFSDGLQADLERLEQINDVLRQTGTLQIGGAKLKCVDILAILPSRDLSEIARAHVLSLPRSLRVLLRTMGALNPGGGDLMSYLMFEGSYTRELIALGYSDAMARSIEITAFLSGEQVSADASLAARRVRNTTAVE
ncbi:MAG: patatin-like phospholipase family protein [Candidatus Obscuribacterales bacterium]|nr:patatin-like phospholipase family protein [Steroidobacteraceae bacterium]